LESLRKYLSFSKFARISEGDEESRFFPRSKTRLLFAIFAIPTIPRGVAGRPDLFVALQISTTMMKAASRHNVLVRSRDHTLLTTRCCFNCSSWVMPSEAFCNVGTVRVASKVMVSEAKIRSPMNRVGEVCPETEGIDEH